MRYKCKENDAIIETGRKKDELLFYTEYDSVKIVIGLKDLIQALNLFSTNGILCIAANVGKKCHAQQNIYDKCILNMKRKCFDCEHYHI